MFAELNIQKEHKMHSKYNTAQYYMILMECITFRSLALPIIAAKLPGKSVTKT